MGRAVSIAALVVTSLVIWRVGVTLFAPPVGWLAGWLVALSPLIALETHRTPQSTLPLAFVSLAFAVAWRGRKLFSATSNAGTPQRPRAPFHGLRALPHLVAAATLIFAAFWTKVALSSGACEAAFGDHPTRPTKNAFALTAPLLQTILLPVLLWPASIGLAPGLVLAWNRGFSQKRHTPESVNRNSSAPSPNPRRRAQGNAYSFCLYWTLCGWLLGELLSYMVPNGTLLAYPSLALLCVRGVYSLRNAWEPVVRSTVGRFTVVACMFVSEAVAIGIPLAIAFGGSLSLSAASLIAPAGPLIVIQVLLWFAALSLRQRNFPRALLILSICGALSDVTLYQFIVPELAPRT